MATAGKIEAFRTFAFKLAEEFLAPQLAEEYVGQLCLEFEREVNTMWNDCVAYRNELARCSELLSNTIEREKTMHQMFETIAQMTMQQYDQSSKGQNASLGTEGELNRIVSLLSVPLVPEPSAFSIVQPRPSSQPSYNSSYGYSVQVPASISTNSRSVTPRPVAAAPVLSSPSPTSFATPPAQYQQQQPQIASTNSLQQVDSARYQPQQPLQQPQQQQYAPPQAKAFAGQASPSVGYRSAYSNNAAYLSTGKRT